MKRLITFSTGSFYDPNKKRRSINEEINFLKKLSIDGAEIMIPTVPMLNKLKISKNNIKYLKSLKYVTIHSPFEYDEKHILYYYNTLRCKKILKKLNKIYNQINAKNIVFHTNQIKNFKVFDEFLDNYQYSIENSTKRHGIKLKEYKEKLKNNPKFKFVLDISHVSEQSPKLIKNYVKNLKNRIIYIHLSAINKNKHAHKYVHKNKHMLKYLNPIKKLKCPICIETGFEKIDFNSAKKEIKFLRKW